MDDGHESRLLAQGCDDPSTKKGDVNSVNLFQL